MAMRLKILILNGSTPATVQALTILDPAKYEVHVCDSNNFCWARFHRHCSQFFQSPRLNRDINAYLEFLLHLLKQEKYDVILPIHEEGLFLAKYQHELQQYTHILLGSAEVFNTIMSKQLCLTKAKSLGIPVPKMTFLKSASGLTTLSLTKPTYVKTPYGTSSSGVARIATDADRQRAIHRFRNESDLIVQEEVVGQQLTIQTIFVRGKLIASHQYLALSTGFGGGASHRQSQNDDDIRSYAEKLGKALNWTGPMMLDFIREKSSGTSFILEGNPRIGETINASLAGPNMPEMMIKTALGDVPRKALTSKNGVESHQMTTEVTGAIRRGASLGEKYTIAINATFRRGTYAHSVDEFLHLSLDPVSTLMAAMLLFSLPFITKNLVTKLDQGATKNMVLSREIVETILAE